MHALKRKNLSGDCCRIGGAAQTTGHPRRWCARHRGVVEILGVEPGVNMPIARRMRRLLWRKRRLDVCRRKKPGTLVVRACSDARRTARMVVRRESGGPANALAHALAKREESWRLLSQPPADRSFRGAPTHVGHGPGLAQAVDGLISLLC